MNSPQTQTVQICILTFVLQQKKELNSSNQINNANIVENIRLAQIEYRSYDTLFIFIFDSQRQMIIQKQRIKEAILSNYSYSMNKKMKKQQQKSILPFQRNKEQLLREILEQYSRNIKKSQKNSTPVFIISQIQSAQSQKFDDYLSNKPKCEINDEISQQSQSKQSVQIQYLNQYFSKQAKEVNRFHISKEIDIAVNSQDHYDLIDNFVQTGNIQYAQLNTQPHAKITANLKADSKSFNQSTMALSKFYKTQHSPRRIIRKTEEYSHFKSRIKHQYIADEKDRSQYSQKQQHIFKSGLLKDTQRTPNSKQKQFIGHISHSKINHTINQYSSSLFSLSQNQVRQQFTQRSSNKKSSIISVQQNRQSMSNSEVISIDLTDKLKQKSIKKVFVDLDLKQKSLEQIQEATENINSFSELERYAPYNYDEERNIFDQIPQKKKIDLNEIKKSFQGFKNQFKIKDEQKFKKQIEQSKIRQKNTQKYMNKTQSQKQKLFNAQPDKNYDLFLSKNIKKPISTQERLFDVEQFEQLVDKEQKILQQNSGIFDFLKRKVTKLHEEKKKSQSQTKNTFDQKKDKIIVAPITENKNEAIHDVEMKQQLSQSSSCSFLKEKECFNEDGVRKVSRIVSQSIRKVNQNLDKIDVKDSKVSKQHKHKKMDEQIDTNPIIFSKKRQQILQDQPKKETLQKLFGTNTKSKVIQEANVINNFFGNHDNSHTFSDMQSHPSTVQKIDERSDDKSQVMKNLQDLRDYSIAADLFNKNNDILEKKSMPPSDLKQNPLRKSFSQVVQVDEPLNLFKQFQVKQQQKKSKHIQIDLFDLTNLGKMQMSQDALSLSKFANVSNDVSIPSFKINHSIAYQPTDKIDANPKRVEISIDLASQIQHQSSLQNQKDGKSSDSQADISALQDYQSDQQGQNHQKAIKNEVKVTELAPVLEQDLQQSQFRKNKNLKFSLNKKQKNKSFKFEQPLIKKVISELSNVVSLKNTQSENIELQFSKENSNRHSQKDRKKLKITLKSSQIPNEEHKISSKNQEPSLSLHSLADETQKNFINGLKNDLSNLKSKIQSSIIYDKNDSSKILSYNSQQKKSNSNNSKIINIQLSSLMASTSNKNDSKILKQKSLKQDKFQIAKLNANKIDSKSIDFDQINASVSEQSFFQNFKDEFVKLKKKIQIDAGIPVKKLD